jgi:hypothetical protein
MRSLWAAVNELVSAFLGVEGTAVHGIFEVAMKPDLHHFLLKLRPGFREFARRDGTLPFQWVPDLGSGKLGEDVLLSHARSVFRRVSLRERRVYQVPRKSTGPRAAFKRDRLDAYSNSSSKAFAEGKSNARTIRADNASRNSSVLLKRLQSLVLPVGRCQP